MFLDLCFGVRVDFDPDEPVFESFYPGVLKSFAEKPLTESAPVGIKNQDYGLLLLPGQGDALVIIFDPLDLKGVQLGGPGYGGYLEVDSYGNAGKRVVGIHGKCVAVGCHYFPLAVPSIVKFDPRRGVRIMEMLCSSAFISTEPIAFFKTLAVS